MKTPTARDYKYMADRAFAMRNAISEIESLRNFTLTADSMREEITRVVSEMNEELDRIKSAMASA